MNTPTQYKDEIESVSNQPAAPVRGQPYQFSNEEIRVLKECNRDSFLQRCLPIGTLFGVATYYGVQGGHLKPSPRWGATPKVIVGSIIGYFIGKISYQSKCAEKLMQLPDSRIGALLRQRKRGTGFQESLEPGLSLNPFSSVATSDTYSDKGPSNSIDLDTNRPEQYGLDDSHRPTVEDNHPVFEEESMPVPQDKITSYEELRKQNRDEYQKQRAPGFKGIASPIDVPPVRRSDQETSSIHTPKHNSVFEDEPYYAHQAKTTTYDELRKRNREEYRKRRNVNYKNVNLNPNSDFPSETTQSDRDTSFQSSYTPPKRTNIYGDIIE